MAQPPRKTSMTDPSTAAPQARTGTSDLDQIPDPDGHPIIPVLGSLAPSIFVPITDSSTFKDTYKPFTTTKVEAMQKELEAMDSHAIASRENFLALCHRERQRIFQEGRRFEALEQKTGQVSPELPRGLHPKDQAAMIANMEAEPERGKDYNLSGAAKPVFQPQQARSLRERQAKQMMQFADFAAEMGETREDHVAKRRAEFEAELKKEQAKEDLGGTAK
ncbi:hypothetical protein FALBO_10867 [Fusarium albosuccineum]|uniref:Uncharacterized protein n=1 Tax=Fusarium albosuccineum TaxID=1237068 RepID=A0A8H4P9F3_9HYPO|nr:hypothetical protein FALBO_10867 [Fusarium albosuccineum]